MQDAVKQRIKDLAHEHGMTINMLAERSGLTPAALKFTVTDYATVKGTKVTSIKRICEGLGIEFRHFWDSPLFDETNLDFEADPDDES